MTKEEWKTLTELTEEQKQKPYAKYVFREIVPAAKEVLDAIQKPMDPSKALPGNQVSRMYEEGYHEVENGWCVFPDGGGYVCIHTRMPNTSMEVWDWWSWWRPAEDLSLRYKIWNPACHYLSYNDGPGNHEWFLESFLEGGEVFLNSGAGFPISFLGVSQETVDGSSCKTPGCVTLYSHSIEESMLTPPKLSTIGHFIRPMEGGGIEVRSRFWLGFSVEPGRGMYRNEYSNYTEKEAYEIAFHCAQEFANLDTVLTSLYEEENRE